MTREINGLTANNACLRRLNPLVIMLQVLSVCKSGKPLSLARQLRLRDVSQRKVFRRREELTTSRLSCRPPHRQRSDWLYTQRWMMFSTFFTWM